MLDEPPPAPRELSGWGRTAPTVATYARVKDIDDLTKALLSAGPRGFIARGLGRSYGDPAQNAGGMVVHPALDRVLDVDVESGTVTAEAGVTIGQLITALRPHGRFVPVTPGTRAVTLGGALAADIHGKNHHRDGSIGRHVLGITLMLADGAIRTVSPALEEDPELFWATLGGMGLTGVIVAATLRTRPVETGWMTVDSRRAPDLDALLSLLGEADRHEYSVAWLDCTAAGRRLGRGIVAAGDHATVGDVRAWTSNRRRQLAEPDPDPDPRITAPRAMPGRMLNRWTSRLINSAWYAKGPRERYAERQSQATFFHPLDGIAGWNTLYGPRGLVQYQCVVPDGGTLVSLVQTLQRAKAPACLAVLKRFGEGTPGPLSFPRPGWTLAVDLPAETVGLGAVLDRMDQTVADAGGSVYLAKDSRLKPELVELFYPRLGAWRDLRDRVDPERRFQSDQSRRLAL